MSNMDIMYRAYRELLTAMGEAATYSEMTEALSRADDGRDMHGGTVSLREIDMDWVEAIEKAIPYIDAAIREQRRFIVQEDEIVPIEKSRKITSESVRHLAQHTNMIAKVEGDEVTPESILNIYREESFAIYENRFLRTLLENASRFVEKRYEALEKVPGESVAQLAMSRTVRIRQEQVRVQLSYETEYRDEDEVDIAADVSKLSKFQRVLRVRKILRNFMSTPLMRSLADCEPVRPPITRTNLLTKNTNFRAALDLWIFIEGYTKNGYYTVLSEADGTMDKPMKHSLYDVISLTRFVVRMNLSDSIRKGLEEEYEAENLRRAAEAARIEEERRQAEEKRLKMALAEQAQRYEDKIEELTAYYNTQIDKLREAYEIMLYDQKQAYESELAEQKQAYESELAGQKQTYESAICEQKQAYESEISGLKEAYESELAGQREAYESVISDRKRAYESAISEQKSAYETQIRTLTDNYEARMAAMKEVHLHHVEELTETYEMQLVETKAHYETQLSKKRDAYETHIAMIRGDYEARIGVYEDRVRDYESRITNYETTLSDRQSTYEKELLDRKNRYEANLTEQRMSLENKLIAEKEGFKKELTDQKNSIRAESRKKTQALIDGYEADLMKEKTDRIAELAALKNAHETELAAVKSEHESELTALKNSRDTELAAQQDAHALEIKALDASHEKIIADQALRHANEIQTLLAKNKKDREETAQLGKQLKALAEENKALQRKSAYLEQRIAKVEERASRRIARADAWNGLRVKRLKSKLDKALQGYSLEEITMAGEEFWSMTAGKVFDADEEGTSRFEFYRFKEVEPETGENAAEAEGEKSVI